MQSRLIFVSIGVFIALGILAVTYPEMATALLVIIVLSTLIVSVFRRFAEDKEYVTNIFFVALIVRLAFGVFIYALDLREFFGADAATYDYAGDRLMDIWAGNPVANDPLTQRVLAVNGAGWGMNYFVGGIYSILGRNFFAAQSICALIGAATAPMVYMCAIKIFGNLRVAKHSALFIALFPSFIIWSSQLMKDGLIIFLLVLVMTMILQIQERLNYVSVFVLLVSLFGIMSLRFYIFYMLLVAVAGSFLIGTSGNVKSMIGRSVALVVLGLGLTYFGVIKTGSADLDKFANLQAIQNSRSDLAKSANSGFGAELDVSTADGAIIALPVGLTYLMLAPFPWQMSNLRQAITLPEVLTWWALIPLLISGFWYSLRHRLRKALPVLIFSITLTLAYSIFQGNVGTAYRQRTQIQVFLFMFIAVGWVLMKEKRENIVLERRRKREMLEASLRGRMTQ